MLKNLTPQKLKNLSIDELDLLSTEIRNFLLNSVNRTGGHLSSNLGVVELTIAIHYCFNLPLDHLIFDVSHQSYTHKILSSRYQQFSTLRKKDGLTGFTNPEESSYDVAHLGHAGTSISIMMGIQTASKITNNTKNFSISVIGDSSIVNGTAFEALNHIQSLNLPKSIIILNDNQMSIDSSVGSLSQYFAKLKSHPHYNKWRYQIKKRLRKLGKKAFSIAEYIHDIVKHSTDDTLFSHFGIRYLGPIDGHDLKALIQILENIKSSSFLNSQPIIVHIITKKGKGDSLSEKNPEKYHSVSSSQSSEVSYTDIFAHKLTNMQKNYGNITATTAGMPTATGLKEFSTKYPQHFFDTGITEGHAVAFSNFLAYDKKLKPFIAIYSTFLQRALDQIFQEVILQTFSNPVFIIDRAGFVGEDGVTHHGIFDISFLKAFPHLFLLAPSSGQEFEAMLEWSYHQKKPCFIRIPRAKIPDSKYPILINSPSQIIAGRSSWILKDPQAKITIIAYGSCVEEILAIQESLPKINLVNLRFAKPLDLSMIQEVIQLKLPIISFEEHSKEGGVGQSIGAIIQEKQSRTPFYNLSIPDQFFQHATRKELLEEASLHGQTLIDFILDKIN